MGCVCARESVTVDGRPFLIRGRLGEGGFSYVDLVEDSRTRCQYALKRIICHSKEDENVAQKEVDYMKALDHPNLVSLEVSAIIPVNDRSRSVISEVMVVMPFYKKGTLHNELEVLATKQENMPEAKLIRVFHGICEGLKAIHTHKPAPLAHRDVKPHNVLMADDGTPVLMDFGSMGKARMEIRGTRDAMALQDLAAERCSMPYRAPELFNVDSHGTIDERVDIWSLGCTLYAMCYHESPFDKAYQRGDSIALAVLAGNIKFPENSIYSPAMKELILDLLVINPAERPFIDSVIDKVNAIIDKHENRL